MTLLASILEEITPEECLELIREDHTWCEIVEFKEMIADGEYKESMNICDVMREFNDL